MAQWVTSFKVSISPDLKDWVAVEDGRVFKGNEDQDTKAVVLFESTVTARYVRIHPASW